MLFYIVFPFNDPQEIWKPIKELQKMWEIFKVRYVWFGMFGSFLKVS